MGLPEVKGRLSEGNNPQGEETATEWEKILESIYKELQNLDSKRSILQPINLQIHEANSSQRRNTNGQSVVEKLFGILSHQENGR